ncbi:DUF2807 domain-containing protein [Pedobacter sp. Du54]|uniref:GIN domain-containing protein n=1 Tax=Pedobacter anseongensis TaxID=3133439 RepID=UPI0030A00B71
MTTSIKNLITATLTFVVLTSTTIVAKADNNNNTVTVLSDVKKVNKVTVSGNVEVILVQSEDESVKVYDNYYAKNALVQQKNGELRISSYEKEKLTVVVYVTNLSAITASDNASVRTHGAFSALDLEVNLKDNATANLNTKTISLSSDVKDNSSLNLTGSTIDYFSVVNSLSKVNMNTFVAENSNIRSQNLTAATVKAIDFSITE